MGCSSWRTLETEGRETSPIFFNSMTSENRVAEIEEQRRRIIGIKSRRVTFLAIMTVLIFVVMGYSFTVGSSSLTAIDAYKILFDQIFPGTFESDFPSQEVYDNYVFIVTELRAPRVLVAALVGAIFAIGGCITQSILKNPLATPYTLGVSSGACVGASLYYIMGISIVGGTLGLMFNAFIFALLPVVAMMFAITRRTVSSVMLVLSGVAFSYIFSSMNSVMQYFGDDSAVANVVFWTIGDLSRTDLWMVPMLFVGLIVYMAFVVYFGKDMDIMRMGDDTASSLGVNVNMVRSSSMIAACLMTALSVSCTGPIGFICLLAPHICRRVVGSDMRWLAPSSACVGAMLMLVADMISKALFAPVMLPVGAITAIIGAPVMVYMLYSRRGLKA